MRRVLGIQERQAQLEVGLGQGLPGVSQPGRRQAGLGPLVGIPQGQGLLEAEHRPGESLVVAAGLGPAQVVFRAGGQHDAFRVRLVLANRVLEIAHTLIAVGRLAGHGHERDRHQLAGLRDRHDLVLRRRQQALHHALAGMRLLARDDLEQDRSQQINVAGRPDPLERARGHLGGHVGRRAPHAAGLRDAARFAERRGRERQPPVHHQHFAEVAQHRVLGLDVAVHHSPGMGKADGIGHLHQDFEIFGQRLAGQHLAPGSALDPLHRIEQRAGLVGPQVVDRDDVRMVEIAGDDRLGEELFPLVRIAGHVRLEHLDGHGAVDRRLPRRVHHAHPAFTDRFQQLVVAVARGNLARSAEGPLLDDQPRVLVRLRAVSRLERRAGARVRRKLARPHPG